MAVSNLDLFDEDNPTDTSFCFSIKDGEINPAWQAGSMEASNLTAQFLYCRASVAGPFLIQPHDDSDDCRQDDRICRRRTEIEEPQFGKNLD